MLTMRFSKSALFFGFLVTVAAGSLSLAEQAGGTGQSPAPSTSTASQSEQPPPDSELAILRRLEADYVRAEVEDNATIAKTILADDYIGIKSDGTTTSKWDVLNNLAAQARNHQPILITAINMREHLFGDAGCVTYTKVYTRPNTGASSRENVLHIFTKRNGVWHLQVSTLTPMPRSPR